MRPKQLAAWAKRSAANVILRSPTYMACDGCGRSLPLRELRPDLTFTALLCHACFGVFTPPGETS